MGSQYIYFDFVSTLWIAKDLCLSQECRNRHLHTPVYFLYNSNDFESLLWIPRDPLPVPGMENKPLHTLWISQ